MSSDSPFNESEFSGDETGQIFIAPDAIPESLSSAERSVDTQSGFVVNVKNIDGRISFSVKRRVGTPPTSSVVFTPDESLKLSKILALSSSDELTGMVNYYAATNLKHRSRAVRMSRMLRALPMVRITRIAFLVSVLIATMVGYCSHPMLDIWLKSIRVHTPF